MSSLKSTNFFTWLFTAFVNTFQCIYNALAFKSKRALSKERIQEIVTNTDAVCFDVDSTVLNHEAIVCLSEACGAQEEITRLTNTAMSGELSFRDSLRLRLNIMKPSKSQVEHVRTKYSMTVDDILTPGIRELVQLLHSKGIAIYLISGGFKELIEPVADSLSIPRENIYANVILFNEEGEYAGFDEDQFTSSNGGKTRALTVIKKIHKSAIMVGDGMTDYEAYPPADLFIGFGGNVERKAVKKVAPWYIYKFQEIIDIFE